MFANPNADVHDIEVALRRARAWKFVSEMKDGIETNVGPGGSSLSGGQK
jgi:ABC-type multidrug transport system fused ATPase/permease subunit